MSGPAIVVVAGITTGIIAARGFDGPTAQDYYKEGLAINEELGRVQRGQQLGIEAVAKLSGINDGHAVRVEVVSREPMPAEAGLQIRLIHPGKRELDRQAMLSRVEAQIEGRGAAFVGSWRAAEPIPADRPVAWSVVLETQNWRVDGKAHTATGGEFRIAPQSP